MNGKVLAGTAIVVVIVVVAAVAVFAFGNDGGEDDTPSEPSALRQEIYPGDGFALDMTVEVLGQTETMRMEVRVGSTDGYYMTATILTDGTSTGTQQFGYDTFMLNISMDDDLRAASELVRTETIGTAFGDRECDVYRIQDGGDSVTVWVDEHGVKYRQELSIEYPISPGYSVDATAKVDLVSCTMLGGAPEHDASVVPCTPAEPGEVVDNLRITLRPGDGYTVETVTDSGMFTEVYEIQTVDGDAVVYTHTLVSGGTETTTVRECTVDEFLEGIAPMMYSLGPEEPVTTQTVDTIAGEVECGVYQYIHGENSLTICCSVNTYVVYSVTLITSDGDRTMTLAECSLLVAE